MIINQNPGSAAGNPKLENVDTAINQLDEQRLEGLKAFQATQTVKDEILNREKVRLTAKYGADHPMVKETESRLIFNQQMVVGLNKEIEKASINTQPFNGKSWRINGKVFDQNNMPVQGVTVYFSDQKKNWIIITGNACTNETGYYSLTLDEKVIKSLENQAFYLSVSDKDKKLVYLDSESLIVKKGMIIYRDIILSESKNTCEPPPDNSVIESSSP